MFYYVNLRTFDVYVKEGEVKLHSTGETMIVHRKLFRNELLLCTEEEFKTQFEEHK